MKESALKQAIEVLIKKRSAFTGFNKASKSQN